MMIESMGVERLTVVADTQDAGTVLAWADARFGVRHMLADTDRMGKPQATCEAAGARWRWLLRTANNWVGRG